MNNAVVGKLVNIKPIVGADKIVVADVFVQGIKQASVVVGVGTPENRPVVYFTSNLCLTDKVITKYKDLGTYLGRCLS